MTSLKDHFLALRDRLQSKKAGHTAAQTASPRRHSSVVEADPYAFATAHARQAWLLRLSSITNVGLLATVVVLANAIGAMAPLKRTEIALVRTYGPDDKLYRVEPISEEVEGFQFYLESMARQYVRLVLEIDAVTQEQRHKEAALMSDGRWWKRFRKDYLDTKAMAETLESGLVRTIKIETVTTVPGMTADRKVVVDYTQTDTLKGRVVSTKRQQAFLAMETRPQSVRTEDRYTNPLGVTVLELVLKERPA